MQLSIIVPVYNVEKYILKCLRSILNMDISPDNYEIIIINDGSTDSSIQLLEPVLEGLLNVLIINQENRGLGAARNAGLKVAKGNYVYFLDSDDYVDTKNFVRLFKDNYQRNVDVIMGNAVWDYGNDKVKCFFLKQREELELSGVDFFNSFYKEVSTMVWRSFYRRSFLLDKNLFFTEDIYFEDMNWTPKVLISANRIVYRNMFFYNYVQRNGSIIKSSYSKKKFEDILYICKDVLRFASTVDLETQRTINTAIISTLLVHLGHYLNVAVLDNKFTNTIGEILNNKFHKTMKISFIVFLYNCCTKWTQFLLKKKY